MTEETTLPSDKRFCECGCGTIIDRYNKKRGYEIRFERGHSQKGKRRHPETLLWGERHPMWKGGKRKRMGYIYVLNPNHPRADGEGYIPEHVFVYEEYHKCCVLRWAVIHHINEIRTDNRPENLMALPSLSIHTILHNTIDMSNRRCIDCGTNEGGGRRNRTWFVAREGGWRCTICHKRYKYREKKKRGIRYTYLSVLS